MKLNQFAKFLRDSYTKYGRPKEKLMHIEVVGHRSKQLKDLMAQAVEFYCSLLLSKRMQKSIEVYVILKKNLENNYSGFCTYVDHHKGKRIFEIELAKGFTVRDTFCSLAHEVVHLKQFATGELKDYLVTANVSKFKGELLNESKIDYWDLPYEIEAYGREKGLFTRFVYAVGLDADKKFLNSKVK